MNKYTRILILLCVSWIGTQAQQSQAGGQTPAAFTLKQAVEYAKKNNYALKNNQLDVTASEKKVKEILAQGLPQVNASGNFTNNLTIPTNFVNFGGTLVPIKFGQPYTATGLISANQLIFDGSFFIGVKAAKDFVNLSKLNISRSEIETEVSVTKAYYLSLLLQTNIALLDTNIKTLAKSRNDLEKLYKNGMVEKTDFDRITLQYSTIQLQRDRVIDQQRIATMVLKLQMGMNVNDSIILSDQLAELYKTTQAPAVEAKRDYTKRTEYQLIEQQIRLQNYDKKRYQFGYAPTLNGFFQHQQNSFDSTFSGLGSNWYPGTVWGLNLNIPIFDGFRKSAQIQQAKINIAKSENDKKNLENVIDQQVYQAKMAFERSGQQLKIQEGNLQLAQDIYNRVNIKYNNGLGSSLELTTAVNDLETARTNYLTNVYDYFVAQIDLKKAVGDIK